jgi:large subunit ribosomal protein L6
MSRVGLNPIPVPSGVEVTVTGRTVAVKGPKGELSQELPETITAEVSDGLVQVKRTEEQRTARALHGLSRALLANMVIGVSEGFTKELEIVGVGYRAIAQGDRKLELQLGFSHPVHIEAPEGISFSVPVPTQVIISGADKQAVGQVAADIRSIRKPEPYKGKGVRYKDERVRRKAGKAAGN